MKVKVLIAGLLAIAIVLVAAPAVLAATYAGGAANPTSGPSGTAVTWTAGGFTAGDTVTFRFCTLQEVVGTPQIADSSGNATISFTVPPTAPVGACTITATGGTPVRVVSTPFTVTGTSSLAYTGAQILFWVMAGLGLAAIGAGLLMKRRTVSA